MGGFLALWTGNPRWLVTEPFGTYFPKSTFKVPPFQTLPQTKVCSVVQCCSLASLPSRQNTKDNTTGNGARAGNVVEETMRVGHGRDLYVNGEHLGEGDGVCGILTSLARGM